MVILCITFLLKDRAHETPAEIGNTTKPTPRKTDKHTEDAFAPIIKTVSPDFNIEVAVFICFFVLWIFLK